MKGHKKYNWMSKGMTSFGRNRRSTMTAIGAATKMELLKKEIVSVGAENLRNSFYPEWKEAYHASRA